MLFPFNLFSWTESPFTTPHRSYVSKRVVSVVSTVCFPLTILHSFQLSTEVCCMKLDIEI